MCDTLIVALGLLSTPTKGAIVLGAVVLLLGADSLLSATRA
ncbi:MAG: hypothetical protein ACOCSD_07320 [Halolamina sp.]